MRLTMKDARAVMMVSAAVVFYALWASGTVAANMSTRVAATIVFALGWLGCTSDTDEMRAVFGVDASRRPPMVYVALTSAMGAIALVAGIIAIVAANETMLATLAVSMAGLLLMATGRHSISGRSHSTPSPV
jgi:hypothetical protein